MTYTPHTVWIGGPPKIIRRPVQALRPASPDKAAKFDCIQAQANRNRIILQCRKQGATFPDIALQVGVSSERCRQIYHEHKGLT